MALELIQKYSLFNFGMKSFKENPEILLKIKELLGMKAKTQLLNLFFQNRGLCPFKERLLPSRHPISRCQELPKGFGIL